MPARNVDPAPVSRQVVPQAYVETAASSGALNGADPNAPTLPLALGRPTSRRDPVVTVVVVTHNPGTSLDTCLASLPLALDVPFEVRIVDNASVDGAPQRYAARHGAQLIEVGRNAGYGTAANIGAAGVCSPWVLVVNPDTEFLPRSLSRLLAAAQRWPRAGVLGPALLSPDGSRYPSARAIPSLTAGIGHALCVRWWPSNPWTKRYRRESQVPVESGVGWLSGACMLFRTAAFTSVSGFDEQYFMYFEDLDVCERLTRAGWINVYVPSAAVRHTGGQSTSQVPREMTLAHHRSAARYLLRKYSKPRHAPLRLAVRVGLAARGRLLVGRLPAAHGPGSGGAAAGQSEGVANSEGVS